MIVYCVIGVALLAASLTAGWIADRWAVWKPAHDLDRLFAERRREARVAATRLPVEATSTVVGLDRLEVA